jgi:hypothetical protein
MSAGEHRNQQQADALRFPADHAGEILLECLNVCCKDAVGYAVHGWPHPVENLKRQDPSSKEISSFKFQTRFDN